MTTPWLAIPTDQVLSFWDQLTTLDGTDYTLGFRYNAREGVYYMIIADNAGNVLNGGIKIVSDWLLMQDFNDPTLPPGDFMAVASGADDSPAALGELGGRVTLYYIPQAAMQEAGIDKNRDPLALLAAT